MNWVILFGLFGQNLWGADQQISTAPDMPVGPTLLRVLPRL
ncbi:MAG: hypothetical protein ACSNEK_02830 [Parachlamydiaceae bacterium]